MLETIKKFFTWLIKISKEAWAYLRSDINRKIKNTSSLSLKETLDIVGKESVSFFASAAKKFGTLHCTHYQFFNRRVKPFSNVLLMPYESCFDEGKLNLLELLYQLSKPLVMRLWTGKRVHNPFITIDLNSLMNIL